MDRKRLAGGVLMGVGALAAFAGAGLAVFAANFLDPDNLTDGLSAIGMVAGPFLAGGSALLAAGRWLYGDWAVRAPLRNIGSRLALAGGLIAAAACLFGLARLLVLGFEPQDLPGAVILAMGAAAGALSALAGARVARAPAAGPL
jgi:hypothetical protein